MQRTRINTPKNTLIRPPTCVNFSELEESLEEMGETFSPGDGGKQADDTEDKLAYETLICDLLSSLEDRDRVIFLLQLLRDCGYRIDHGSFAQSMKISRSKYMGLLADVRMKINLYLLGTKVGLIEQ